MYQIAFSVFAQEQVAELSTILNSENRIGLQLFGFTEKLHCNLEEQSLCLFVPEKARTSGKNCFPNVVVFKVVNNTVTIFSVFNTCQGPDNKIRHKILTTLTQFFTLPVH
jgi:hypothetical protein